MDDFRVEEDIYGSSNKNINYNSINYKKIFKNCKELNRSDLAQKQHNGKHYVESAGLRSRSKQVRTTAALLGFISDLYTWESYEPT